MIDTAERRLSEADPRISTHMPEPGCTPEPRRTQEDWLRAFESWKGQRLVAVGRDRAVG